MTPIEIEQMVNYLKNKFDNLEKTVNEKVDEKLKELTESKITPLSKYLKIWIN